MALLITDILLVALLLGLGLATLLLRDMRRAIQSFIAFVILLSVVWLRLQSPEVAAAELLLGAVLTGWLLLRTLRFLEGFSPPGGANE